MDAERTYYQLLADGDPEVTAEYERWPGVRRRNDPIGEWPTDKLGELLRLRPDLEAEVLRRRPEVGVG